MYWQDWGVSEMSEIMKRQNEYLEKFSHLCDELSQFDFLITKALIEEPSLDSDLRSEKYLLQTCQSKLWFRMELTGKGTLHLDFDSDSMILRGFLLVLKDIYEGVTPEEAGTSPFTLMREIKVCDLLTERREDSIGRIIQTLRQISGKSKYKEDNYEKSN
jgi:sulfur transfer protein SufE